MVDYSYTAEDFAQAQFAIDPSKDYPLTQSWMRDYTDTDCPWHNGRGEFASDDEMTAERCIPVYAEPYSLEALRRAWEHGERTKSGEVAEDGVSYIWRNGEGQCTLFSDRSRSPLLPGERVVYRPSAQNRESEQNRDPVDDLAQAMEDVLPEEAGSPVALRRYAAALAEYGVRVVADDE